jgi:UDP-N-acetylglucosamine 1-carboxyvinyltransferase
MDKFVIHGKNELVGEIAVSGSKNAALPLMAATLLAPGKYLLGNIPRLKDIKSMRKLIQGIGVDSQLDETDLTLSVPENLIPEAPYEIVKTMRASIYVLGPLLARHKEARVSLPGGCAWGPRPVDYHIRGLQRMGADIRIENGFINARAPHNGLQGAQVYFDIPSVGATGNILMAAVLANGTTSIKNAAIEPEITALIDFLRSMGADIEGKGTSHLIIQGKKELKPANMQVIPDRIEAGTFLVTAVATGGKITLVNAEPDHLTEVLIKLEETGAELSTEGNRIHISMQKRPEPVDVTTAVYPGFPTDMQAQWTALMSVANGSSIITDTIYIDRFAHVAELNRLGTNINRKNNAAITQGNANLKGAHVMSTDLRASASLIIAGLVAEGRTDVSRIYHLDRGYERIERKLSKLGAEIIRADEELVT